MDNEMIERCCTELAQQREQNGAMPYSAYSKHSKSALREDVVSVIKAMREPTEKMLEAGSFIDTAQSGVYSSNDVYTAMIDSILND